MAIFNILAIGLCLRNGHDKLASARRRFSAKPAEALKVILQG